MIRNGIDITKCDVRCWDELIVEEDFINATYELWFDVEQYFNVNLHDGCHIYLYTNWFPDEDIEVLVHYVSESHILNIPFNADEEEKNFFRNKMEEHCMKLYGKTLIELLNEYNDEGE